MGAVKPLIAKLGLGLTMSLALGACARTVDMSLASLHQRPAEFDFLVYQEGWACLSDSPAGRDAGGPSCASGGGRQLRELFAQRSGPRSLRDYLAENGANCRSSNTLVTCSYTKTAAETPFTIGRQATASREEGVVLTIVFPVKDQGLAPDQIRTSARRFTRVL